VVPWSPEVERTRAAVNLVMQDVEAELGPGALTVIVGSQEELAAELPPWASSFPSRSNIYGWVFMSGDGAIGLCDSEGMPWEDLVVRIADTLQERIIEGSEHWGATFPTCPKHRSHPMNAEVVADVASWVCRQGGPRRSVKPIAIGTLRLTDR